MNSTGPAAAQHQPSPPTPTITAAVCVYTERRWDRILLALSSLEDQTLPPDEVLVVVDHNPSLHARLSTERPSVRVVESQYRPGLSGGRNTALELAKGELIAFLDDDARASSDWLETLVRPMTDGGVLGVGSRVDPEWETHRPRWWPAEFDWVVGCTYRGMSAKRTVVRNPSGGAMVLRRDLRESAGLYRVDLGRVGERPLGCEETEYCLRASTVTGGVFLYEPAAAVTHLVPRGRCTFSYFLNRCFNEGLSKSIVARSAPGAAPLATERGYVRQILPRGVMAGLADTARFDGSGVLRASAILLGVAAATAGFLVGRLTRYMPDA
jgi:glycosyltransferase involved in cell wall biosynthesis